MLDFNTIAGVSIPFVGTTLGAAMVFFMKDKIHPLLQKALLGFSSGVMMAASVWSLLIPAMDLSTERGMGKFSFLPAISGLLIGILLLLLFDRLIPHLHLNQTQPEGPKSSLQKTTMMILAVAIHNLPEGMAVGAVFAGLKNAGTEVTLASAFALSVGIAIQNFPEGTAVALPLVKEGVSKKRAFVIASMTAVVEPLFGVLAAVFARFANASIAILLAFAAGTMIYVVVEELIPQAHMGENGKMGTLGFVVGFLVMMILDVALG